MSRELAIWIVIVAVGALNYGTRLSFIAWFARREMPPLLERALKHVPAAMLTAIVIPALIFVEPGVARIDAGNLKLLAGLAAAAVAWWQRNTVLTIAVGMGMLWLMQYFVG